LRTILKSSKNDFLSTLKKINSFLKSWSARSHLWTLSQPVKKLSSSSPYWSTISESRLGFRSY
jgi:hypothetical protein